MASPDYPYGDIDDFFSSPIKICSIKINKAEMDMIPFRSLNYYAKDLKDSDWPMILDVKAREDTLYLTFKGKAQPLGQFNPVAGSGPSYNFMVNKALEDSKSVDFYGSLNIRDFIKLFEINMRHQRQYFNDEQVNTIYEEIINSSYEHTILRPYAVSDWLRKTLNSSNSYKYCDMYIIEEEFLKEKGLLDENLVFAQQKFLKDKNFDYYRLEVEPDYLREFMVASKKKGVPRSEVKLLRDALDGCELKEPNRNAKLFKDIFSKRKNSDLELEF